MGKRKGPTPKGGAMKVRGERSRHCLYCGRPTTVGLNRNALDNTANARHTHSPDLCVLEPNCALARRTVGVMLGKHYGLRTFGDPVDTLAEQDIEAYQEWLGRMP